MTREHLAEIRGRFEKYRDMTDVQRRAYFATWQDKRDLYDLIDGLDRMLADRGAESGTEGLMRVVADALASVVKDRALEQATYENNDLKRDNWGLKKRVEELEDAQRKGFATRPGVPHETAKPPAKASNQHPFIQAWLDARGRSQEEERLRSIAGMVCSCSGVAPPHKCLSCVARALLKSRETEVGL